MNEEIPKYCRVCLNLAPQSFDLNKFENGLIKKMILLCVPKFEWSLFDESFVCKLCCEELKVHYDFKLHYLLNEYKVADLEHSTKNETYLCSLCVRTSNNLNKMQTTKQNIVLVNMLKTCLPHSGFRETADHFVCLICMEKLEVFCNFYFVCVKTDEILQNFIRRTEKHLLLNEIVEGLNNEHIIETSPNKNKSKKELTSKSDNKCASNEDHLKKSQGNPESSGSQILDDKNQNLKKHLKSGVRKSIHFKSKTDIAVVELKSDLDMFKEIPNKICFYQTNQKLDKLNKKCSQIYEFNDPKESEELNKNCKNKSLQEQNRNKSKVPNVIIKGEDCKKDVKKNSKSNKQKKLSLVENFINEKSVRLNNDFSGPFEFDQLSNPIKKEKCDLCDFVTSSKANLKRHIKNFHGERKTYKCQDCGFTCTHRVYFRRHLRAHNEPLPMYECFHCGYKARGKQYLVNHLLIHRPNNKKKYHCNECKVDFKWISNLKEHNILYHTENVHLKVCNDCGYIAYKKEDFDSHLLKHDNKSIEKFFCHNCEYISITKDDLAEHVLLHQVNDDEIKRNEFEHNIKPENDNENCDEAKAEYSELVVTNEKNITTGKLKNQDLNLSDGDSDSLSSNTKNFQCKVCNSCFLIENEYYIHMMIHNTEYSKKVLQCPECKFKTKHKDILGQHLSVHMEQLNENTLFECSQCEFVSHDSVEMDVHKLHHGGHDINKVKIDDSYVQTFNCFDNECNYKTRSKAALYMHEKKHTKIFACEHCEYSTSNQSHIKRHEIQHKKDLAEQFVCDQCNFKSHHKYSYDRHQLVHLKAAGIYVKEFSCNVCDFKSKWRHCYVRHMKLHKTEKVEMYKCPDCNLITKYKDYLITRHRLMHEEAKGIQVSLFECDKCSYKTKRKDLLKKHQSKHSDFKFKCHKCDFSSKWKTSMKMHNSIVHSF